MGITKLAIKIALKNKKIESFDNYLFIGPHPDDIEIGAGATIAKLIKLGKNVHYLICTDGRFGNELLGEDIPSTTVAAIRKEECIKAASFLSVNQIHFLDLVDGANYQYEELINGIAEVVNQVKPDILFVPDPDVSSECHIDHLNVGKAGKEIANFANYKDIFVKYLKNKEQVNKQNIMSLCFYMTAKPNKYVKTTKYFKKQLESIAIHASQYPVDSP